MHSPTFSEVIDSDTTPNILSRESTFLMGILKPCFVYCEEERYRSKADSCVEPSNMMSSLTKQQVRLKIPHNLNEKVNLSCALTEDFIKNEYSDVFEGLGRFPVEPYKLKLKPDCTPTKHRPRRVPVYQEEAFHEEIHRLCKIDELEPVTEHTDWVNSYVIVERDGYIDYSNLHSPGHSVKKKLRICLDPKDLNEALE